MNIKEVEIRHFKGLESVRISACGVLNAFVGRNNSGKSSVLHAIDMVGLALTVSNWNSFQPKLEVKDMISRVGDFSVRITYEDGSDVIVTSNARYGPQRKPAPQEAQILRTVSIVPGLGTALSQRDHRTPHWVMRQVENRNFTVVNSLDLLFALKFYAQRSERGLTPQSYDAILDEVKQFFPEIAELASDRTEQDIATLTYSEDGKELDVLYSGTGLKHFLDVLLKIAVSGANVVLIDEPEVGLHPDLQRRFIEYLHRLATEKNLQVFMATHSPVLLNYADQVSYYRVINVGGNRAVTSVPKDAVHVLLSDMGLRPSDFFNQDICLLVEGASDVIFFEHVIRVLYKTEFEKVAVGVLQYGGAAAEGIVSGAIDISNITSAQKYTYWVRDRDATPSDRPSPNATKFRNSLEQHGVQCHILQRREIEYYFPERVLVAAQQGDGEKEELARRILGGDQSTKFAKAAREGGVCVPRGRNLRSLLAEHFTNRDELSPEIAGIITGQLIPWRNEMLGEG